MRNVAYRIGTGSTLKEMTNGVVIDGPITFAPIFEPGEVLRAKIGNDIDRLSKLSDSQSLMALARFMISRANMRCQGVTDGVF